MHKQGCQGGCGRGSCTWCPVQPEQGQRGKGWGLTFVHCSTFPVCTQKWGGANPMQRGGRNSVLPALHIMQRRGAPTGVAQVREGECKLCVCIPPPPLYTPVHMPHCMQRERVPTVGKRGRKGGRCCCAPPSHASRIHESCMCCFYCLYFIIEIKRTQIKFKNWCLKLSG